jgi:phosphocarrier protein
MVLALGVAHGDTVVIAAEGEGAADALDELETLLATNLDAEG